MIIETHFPCARRPSAPPVARSPQVYFNGHNQLACKLDAAGVDYRMLDNAFVHIADVAAAQRPADDVDIATLHAALDRYATLCCPPVTTLGQRYHWSIMQIEYSTDLVFERQTDLGPRYDATSRAAVHAVKAENVATFLGRKLNGNDQAEMGNNFSTRIEGTRIKHLMGPVSIKMYDKRGIILRIETTADDELLLSAIVRGEFTISGLRNKELRKHIPGRKPGWISRCLKRLRIHGLIKRAGKTYKHYLTELGRRVVLTGVKLRELVIIPALAQPGPKLV